VITFSSLNGLVDHKYFIFITTTHIRIPQYKRAAICITRSRADLLDKGSFISRQNIVLASVKACGFYMILISVSRYKSPLNTQINKNSIIYLSTFKTYGVDHSLLLQLYLVAV
jgi:hypothetical protein